MKIVGFIIFKFLSLISDSQYVFGNRSKLKKLSSHHWD